MRDEHDKQIVWPPVVILQNAGLGVGPDGKTIGLDNAEVRLAISPFIEENKYRRVVALYGPRGHLGAAMLLFQDSDVGYVNALKVHNEFKELGRGRDEWKAYSPGESGEKKELFGYLADLRDMETWDRNKKVVKRWAMESFREKVILPQQMRAQASEQARMLSDQKKQESDALELSMQADETKLQARRMQLAEMDEKIEAEKRRNEDLKRMFDEEKAKRRASRQKEREEMLKAYNIREDKKRAELQRGKEILRSELQKIEEEISSCQNSIHKQEKENERRVKMAEFHSEHILQMRKEKHLAELEERKRKDIAEREKAHQAKLLELREQFNKEKMAMYGEHQARKEALVHKMDEAEQESQAQNCIICMDTIKAPTLRMLYVTCGHACVCENCFPEVWKLSKCCPYCRKLQPKKPKKIPATVYL